MEPLAGHAKLGQNAVVGSMMVLRVSLGNVPRGVCLDPRLHYKSTSPRSRGELPGWRLITLHSKLLANYWYFFANNDRHGDRCCGYRCLFGRLLPIPRLPGLRSAIFSARRYLTRCQVASASDKPCTV